MIRARAAVKEKEVMEDWPVNKPNFIKCELPPSDFSSSFEEEEPVVATTQAASGFNGLGSY